LLPFLPGRTGRCSSGWYNRPCKFRRRSHSCCRRDWWDNRYLRYRSRMEPRVFRSSGPASRSDKVLEVAFGTRPESAAFEWRRSTEADRARGIHLPAARRDHHLGRVTDEFAEPDRIGIVVLKGEQIAGAALTGFCSWKVQIQRGFTPSL